MLVRLRAALPDAESLIAWAAALQMPDDPQDFISVSMRTRPTIHLPRDASSPTTGSISTSPTTRRDLSRNTASSRPRCSHCSMASPTWSAATAPQSEPGPIARKQPHAARRHRRGPSDNMFHSLLARTIEIHVALVEAIRLLENYRLPDSPYAEPNMRAGAECGATEAPRGLLWHRYAVDEDGIVRAARIVRRPARTRRASRSTCAAACSPSASITTTMRCACAPRRSSAITTPASPVRRISSRLDVERG